MFNTKKPDSVTDILKPAPSSSPPPVANKPYASYANTPSDNNYSIINEWLTMRGDLESSGDILVKGKVHGNIRCRMLIIDAEAQVEGGIESDEVVIRGQTRGVIRSKRVRVEKTGSVDSEIHHETFSSEEGAKVRGSLQQLDMSSEKAEDKQPAKISREKPAPAVTSVQAAE